MITQKELDTIQAYLDATTQGKWLHTYKDCKFYMSSEFIDRENDPNGVGLVTCDINQHNADLYATFADMEFIAYSHEWIPKLLAEIKRLRNNDIGKT